MAESGFDSKDGMEIHPRIRRHLRIIGIGRWLMFAISGVALIAIAVVLTLRLRDNDQLIIFIAGMTVVTVVFLLLSKALFNPMLKKLREVNAVMLRTQPRGMVMTPTGITTLKGILVELRPAGASEESAPLGLASLQSSKKAKGLRKSLDVEVYMDQGDSNTALALDTGKELFWGNLTDQEERSRMFRSLNLFMVAVIGLLVVCALAFGLFLYSKRDQARRFLDLAQKSSRWPVAQGNVIRSEVKQVWIKKGKSRRRGYRAVVKYEYHVSGKRFVNSRICFCYGPDRDMGIAQGLVQRFPLYTAVNVSYASGAPQNSVLQPGRTDLCEERIADIRLQAVIILIMMGVITLTLAGVMWMQKRKRNELEARLERFGIRL